MYRSSLHASLCLATLTINSPANAGRNDAIQSIGVPRGFEALQSERQVLVDVYFDGAKIGETLAIVTPGFLSFADPDAVLKLVSSAEGNPELVSALRGQLAANSALVCSAMVTRGCGSLSPETAAVIYDEERFRVDIFINPRFLKVQTAVRTGFLPISTAPVSLTSVFGMAAAGTFGGRTAYSFQNRTVASFRSGRIRSSNALASGFGWVVDDLVGEVDRQSMRYSAGLFWAPGDEFVGRRRVLGAGFTTQFDTSENREILESTPLVLFLARPAQVELVVDGRILGSRTYLAGNNELDTSSLSEGSYLVTLRIHELGGGSVRYEQRFFVKDARVAPLGHPVFYAAAGMLANTRAKHAVSVTSGLYYRAGSAVRLNHSLALDVGLVGTRQKAIGEIGGWFLSRPAAVRLAGFLSTSGDKGVHVQLASRDAGPINVNLELRRVWSAGGGALIPNPDSVQSFDPDRPTPSQLTVGSYTQLIASAGARVGKGTLSLVGTYRKDRKSPADYSVGPNIRWPVAIRSGFQLMFQASAQTSRTSTAAFADLILLSTRGRMSALSTFGQAMEKDRVSGTTTSRVTGSVDAQYAVIDDGRNMLVGQAGAERDLRSSTIRGGATYTGNLGNGRLEVSHDLEGRKSTRFDMNFQSGLALSSEAVDLGARQASESALFVSVDGDSGNATFRILVDGVDRGQVRTGQRLSIFLPAYRTYRVRLMPVGAPSVEVDTQARDVTLYPGNVASLRWSAERYVTFFAQALAVDGSAVAGALVQSSRNVAETDDQGYFQIDLGEGDKLRIVKSGETICTVPTPARLPGGDLVSAGKVLCK